MKVILFISEYSKYVWNMDTFGVAVSKLAFSTGNPGSSSGPSANIKS